MHKHHRFPKAIILQVVYFKFRFTLSYRDVEELLRIRGVKVDHFTLQRWEFKFSPLIEANMNKWKRHVCNSWRMDEAYIKLGGKDRYLYRAVDKYWNTFDIPVVLLYDIVYSLKTETKTETFLTPNTS